MKKPVQFSSLDKRRKMIVLGNANGLAVAIELVTKLCGHNVARSIQIQALMNVRGMTDEELNSAISKIDHAVNTEPNITGIHTTQRISSNIQN